MSSNAMFRMVFANRHTVISLLALGRVNSETRGPPPVRGRIVRLLSPRRQMELIIAGSPLMFSAVGEEVESMRDNDGTSRNALVPVTWERLSPRALAEAKVVIETTGEAF